MRFAFSPEQEIAFFNSTPTELFAEGSALGAALGDRRVGQFDAARCPGELIFSSRQELIKAPDVAYLRGVLRHASGDEGITTPFDFVAKDAGHFHPLVDPDAVVEWITTTTIL